MLGSLCHFQGCCLSPKSEGSCHCQLALCELREPGGRACLLPGHSALQDPMSPSEYKGTCPHSLCNRRVWLSVCAASPPLDTSLQGAGTIQQCLAQHTALRRGQWENHSPCPQTTCILSGTGRRLKGPCKMPSEAASAEYGSP